MTDSFAADMNVSHILIYRHPVGSSDRAVDLYDAAKHDESINDYFVLDRNNSPCGIITRAHLAY